MARSTHPVYSDMLRLAENNQTKYAVTEVAFGAFMELCEDRKVSDVSYLYHNDLKSFYFLVKSHSEAESEVFIPISTKQDLSLNFMEQLQLTLDTNRITLMIQDGDTSSSYYRITRDIERPISPESQRKLQAAEDKIRRLTNEIKYNEKLIYSKALKRV